MPTLLPETPAESWKRQSHSTVTEPTPIAEVSFTNNNGHPFKGTSYYIPGFEEYEFVVVPPSSTRTGWNVFEKHSGTVIFTDKPDGSSARRAVEKAQKVLEKHGKGAVDNAIKQWLKNKK